MCPQTPAFDMQLPDYDSDRDETDSLFGSDGSPESTESDTGAQPPAMTRPPPIPGLYMFPRLLPEDTACKLYAIKLLPQTFLLRVVQAKLLQEIAKSDIFCGGQRNQAMLFTSQDSQQPGSTSQLPPYLQDLTNILETLLTPNLSREIITTLFHPSPTDASSRQIILNLYRPGEGITPHIDLPGRYGDGIMGVCLGSGCVMGFERREVDSMQEDTQDRHSVYMPARTVYCMTGDARWEWAHGIPSRDRDVLVDPQGEVRTILRDVRISITLRWMKPGAEVLR